MRIIRTLATGLTTMSLLAGMATGSTAQSADGPTVATVGEGDVWFTGTLSFDGTELPGSPVSHEEHGLWVTEGRGFRDQTMRSDDPRMAGKRTVQRIDITDALSDASAGFTRLLATIETDVGTWTCHLYEVWVATSGDTQSGWCEGAGALDGVRAYVVFETGSADASGTLPVIGFITSGDGPPMPEAAPD